MKTKKRKTNKTVYDIVTEQIITKLEAGTVPWRKPWKNGGAIRWSVNEPYRGINTILLEPGEYASKKQIEAAGGKIKKEEFGNYHICVYWLWKKFKEEYEDGEEHTKRFAKPFYYKVWEINKQCTGLQSKRETATFNHDPIEEADRIYKGYQEPEYFFQAQEATYTPFFDRVSCPPMKHFEEPAEFYSVLFHEMAHSTGHKDRLAREGVTGEIRFGSETYSKEELVAEMTAAMLCGVAGIEVKTIDNSASYIDSWIRQLKKDKKLVVQAAQQAQKAADYIQGVEYEKAE